MPKRKTADKSFIELQKEIEVKKFLENVKFNFKNFPDPRIVARCDYPIWCLFLIISISRDILSHMRWWLSIALMLLITPFTPTLDLAITQYFYKPAFDGVPGHFSTNNFFNFMFVSGLVLAWTLGIALSITRIAQGGHFFSDVLMTALIMWLTALTFDWLIFQDIS